MSEAATRVSAVRRALAGRRLFWFGIRGEDAEGLLELPEFAGSFAVTAPVRSASLEPDHNLALEHLSGCRVDLDRYDLDLDQGQAAESFRGRILELVNRRCVLMTYRPSAFVSSLAFSMGETMTLAGLHKDRQAAFEHKPWVETRLRERGVRTVPWEYVARQHRGRVLRKLGAGALVLRSSRNSGGVGIATVRGEDGLDAYWAQATEPFVSVAPYVAHAVPVNLAGCVFPDGSITVHPPSVQLIGIRGCTDREFGYCGNDFGAMEDLSGGALRGLQELIVQVGGWLHEERYVGAFGVDALVDGDEVLFLEVNPRFQGSSALGGSVADALGEPDLYLDHLAAHLGIDAGPPGRQVRDWVAEQPALAHLNVHNLAVAPVPSTRDVPVLDRDCRMSLWPSDVEIEPGGVLARIAFSRRITETGFVVDERARDVLMRIRSPFQREATAAHSGGAG